MDAQKWLVKYPELSKKSGLYVISNSDFKTGSKYVKVGLARTFGARFSGREHSGYSTSYPTDFQVNYIMTVPNISSNGWTKDGKPTSRIREREREVHDELVKNGVKRLSKTGHGKSHKTEWFEPRLYPTDALLKGLLPVWKKRKEVSTIYECNKHSCNPIYVNVAKGTTKGNIPKPSRGYVIEEMNAVEPTSPPQSPKRGGRDRTKTDVFSFTTAGLNDTALRKKALT
jgi:hypothetical protein